MQAADILLRNSFSFLKWTVLYSYELGCELEKFPKMALSSTTF